MTPYTLGRRDGSRGIYQPMQVSPVERTEYARGFIHSKPSDPTALLCWSRNWDRAAQDARMPRTATEVFRAIFR